MKKYWIIARGVMQETFAYRLNFVMWRVRNVFQLLTLYFLWVSLYSDNTTLFGYSTSEMFTYVLGSAFISSIVFSTRTASIGEEINRGNLSHYLLKPIRYFSVWVATDVGDKAMNIAFSIVELLLFLLFFHPPLYIQSNVIYVFFSIISIAIGTGLFFYINILLGSIGFWSPEVWAPRFIFFILLQFFSGALFPLDVLPQFLYQLFQFSPFPYLLYFPLKIYLGHLSFEHIIAGIFISLTWAFLLYMITKIVWTAGLKMYTAEGR